MLLPELSNGKLGRVLRTCAHRPLRVEPFLYEIVIVKLFPYSPPYGRVNIHRDSVRHLYLRNEMSFWEAWSYLQSCRNIRTLTLFADELAEHPLAPGYSSWSSYRSQCPNVFPVYQHLTHLDLLTSFSPLRQIDWLASLPNLTHLLILSPMENINSTVDRIFECCPKICMMLWCPWDGRFCDRDEPITTEQIQAIDLLEPEPEPRLVVCKISYEQYTAHFIVHAEGKSDYETMWKAAEDIIDRRR